MQLRIKKYWVLLSSVFYFSVINAGVGTFLWGTPVNNSVFYLPIGSHTRDGHQGLKFFELMGGTYKSFLAMTFINSFGNRVFAVGIERYIWKYRRLSVGYGAGLMAGYNGQLSTVYGIPFRNTFLFKYDVNPVIVGIADVAITKKLQLSFVIAPLVVTGGLRYNFST